MLHEMDSNFIFYCWQDAGEFASYCYISQVITSLLKLKLAQNGLSFMN